MAAINRGSAAAIATVAMTTRISVNQMPMALCLEEIFIGRLLN